MLILVIIIKGNPIVPSRQQKSDIKKSSFWEFSLEMETSKGF